jgi:hypothetical protein
LSLVAQAAWQSWVAQLPKPPPPKPVVRDAAAVALLGDLLSEQPPEELAPPQAPPSWPEQDRCRALGSELESIQAALKLIAPEISKARKEYSRIVVAQCGEEHREIVGRAVDAAKELGGALLSYYAFLNQMRLNGVAYSQLKPIPLDQFGNLNEESTPLLRLIRDAVERGHAGEEGLPSWKMPAPIEYFNGGN